MAWVILAACEQFIDRKGQSYYRIRTATRFGDSHVALQDLGSIPPRIGIEDTFPVAEADSIESAFVMANPGVHIAHPCGRLTGYTFATSPA